MEGLKYTPLEKICDWVVDVTGYKHKIIDFSNTNKQEILQELSDIIETAQNNNERTIVQIKNIEQATEPIDENHDIIRKLKGFILESNKDCKYTLIADINDPLNVDSKLMEYFGYGVKIDLTN